MLTHEDYRDYVNRFRQVERYLKSKSADSKTVAYNICKLRGYYPERMMPILEKAGFMFIEGSDSVYDALEGAGSDLGLFTKDDKFLLSSRFIFPVRDMLGNTIALIGWFPDEKKYITTPSRLFSKSCMFFGMEQLATTGLGKEYFLCEGIFDTLSLRSIGFNAVGQMGITSGRVKEGLYPLFSRLVGIPDNDAEGRSVIEFDKWKLLSNASYFKWIGDSNKDIDGLVNSYEAEDIKELLLGAFGNNSRVISVKI